MDGSQYVRPDDDAAVQLMESSNVLAPIVGLRQLRRRAAASHDAAAAANTTLSHVSEPEGEDERLIEPPEFVVDALAAARAQLAAVNSQRIRYDAAVQLLRASEAAPDKVASLSTRQRVHAVSVAWEVFRAEKPGSWLEEGAMPSFEQAWEFVRDELAAVHPSRRAPHGPFSTRIT